MGLELENNLPRLRISRMKIPAFLLVILCLVCVSDLRSQEFNLSTITRTQASGWVSVDDGWVQRADILKVRISPKETYSGKVPLLAGFFDENGRLLRKITSVPVMVAKGSQYQELPRTLEANRTYDVYFPIPPSIATGPNRWKTFAVKVGKGEDTTSALYPANAGDIADFVFNQDGGASDSKTPLEEAVPIEPLIRQVIRYKNAMNGWVDGEWIPGLITLKAKVRLESGAETGKPFVKAYFFDASGNRVLDYQKPPQVEVKRGIEYVSLPPIWQNKTDYEIHFPIPAAFERGNNKWRTAVIVFGNKQNAVAAIYPSGSKEIEDLDFPERDLVLAAANTAP